jgi:hypothetical protein
VNIARQRDGAFLVRGIDQTVQALGCVLGNGQEPDVINDYEVCSQDPGDGLGHGVVGAFQVAIDSGHDDRAPMAAVGLGLLREEQGDMVAAAEALRVAIDSGHADVAPMAAVKLGMVLQEQGELVAAATAFQVAIYSGHSRAAPLAAASLERLREEG